MIHYQQLYEAKIISASEFKKIKSIILPKITSDVLLKAIPEEKDDIISNPFGEITDAPTTQKEDQTPPIETVHSSSEVEEDRTNEVVEEQQLDVPSGPIALDEQVITLVAKEIKGMIIPMGSTGIVDNRLIGSFGIKYKVLFNINGATQVVEYKEDEIARSK